MVIADSSDSAGTNAPGPGLLQAACALTFPRTFPLTFPRAEFFRLFCPGSWVTGRSGDMGDVPETSGTFRGDA